MNKENVNQCIRGGITQSNIVNRMLIVVFIGLFSTAELVYCGKTKFLTMNRKIKNPKSQFRMLFYE